MLHPRRMTAVLLCAALLTGCGADSSLSELVQPAETTTSAAETTTTLPVTTTTTETTTSTTTTTSITSGETTLTLPQSTSTSGSTSAATVSSTAAQTSGSISSTSGSTSLTTSTTTSATTTTVTAAAAPADAAVAQLNALVANYPRDCAITLYSTDGTLLYSYQPKKEILGASLIKLPYAVYCCKQISAGVRSLDETMTYTKDWYHGGSGIIRQGAYGTKYTIAQLLDYCMRYSDNVAYDMLVHLFGIDDFNSMVKSWGYNTAISQYIRFPAVSALFMNRSMLEMKLHSTDGEAWAICWDALVNSVKSYVRDTIGTGQDIAVKYGSIPAQYHEVCYVEADTPYILVILSGAVNSKPDEKFVKAVATAAASLANAHNAGL